MSSKAIRDMNTKDKEKIKNSRLKIIFDLNHSKFHNSISLKILFRNNRNLTTKEKITI